ncbi:hypothetical protein ACROYT_G018103 [Oculina patagonica]
MTSVKKMPVKATTHEASDVLTVKKVIITLLALFALSLVVAGDNLCDECHEDDQVCCNGDCFYGSNCLGLSCSSDSNCSLGESCCSNACVNGSNCLGQNCSSDSDCSSSESCCGEKCKSGDNCVGLSCSTDPDCGTDTCCSGKCVFSQYSDVYCPGEIHPAWYVFWFGFAALFLYSLLRALYVIFKDRIRCCKHARDGEVEDQTEMRA